MLPLRGAGRIPTAFRAFPPSHPERKEAGSVGARRVGGRRERCRSAAQPADLDWEASEVTAPRRGCARPAGLAGAALPPAHPPRTAPPARSGVRGNAGSGKARPVPTF